VVGIHCEFRDPCGEALVEGIFDQGPVKYRDQGLWKNVSERAQSRSEPGSEKEGFLDHGAHGARGGGSTEQMQGFVSFPSGIFPL
jgi:hypothetical protein